MKKEIIIGTFNIQNNIKEDVNNKTEKIVDFINKYNIDFLGLQEVRKEYEDNLIKGNYNVYGNYRFKNLRLLKNINESVKIISKEPIKNTSTVYLSKFLFFPRIMTTVETDNFIFINVHLEFWSNYFRKKELNNLYKYICSKNNKDIILVGDFNTDYNQKDFLNFINNLKKLNINLVNNEEITHKNKIIDFIFVSNNYEILDILVPKELNDISDHNPILVKIKKN
ncbi:MAG: endonuclease/exonuclease/phosphatase family protein [Bacilli bacterium]|nr:endonuclease/exonuclease/phosphatase family protein [Bacilli bacterium]